MSIKLSPKHGVNPAIPVCFFCNEAKNEIILAGQLQGDQEAPHAAVWDKRPCDKCKELMQQGVIFISVREGEQGANPYRTGGWVVVKEEAVRRIVQPTELLADILKSRVAFVPDEAWNKIGLPRAA